MPTDKKEKKEALGTKINISSIVKKAEQKREAKAVNTPSLSQSEEKITKKDNASKNVKMTINVSKTLSEKFRDTYYSTMKELGADYVYLSRGEVFIQLISFMESSLAIDISKYKSLYDDYIAAKGKRYANERTIPKNEEKVRYTWAEFTPEQMETFKRLLTKLAVRVGVEKKSDFSKQYFMVDIIDFFKDNVVELSEYIKKQKNGR